LCVVGDRTTVSLQRNQLLKQGSLHSIGRQKFQYQFFDKSQYHFNGLIVHHNPHMKRSRFRPHRTPPADTPEQGKSLDPSVSIWAAMNFILVQTGMSIRGTPRAFARSGCQIKQFSSRLNLRPYIHRMDMNLIGSLRNVRTKGKSIPSAYVGRIRRRALSFPSRFKTDSISNGMSENGIWPEATEDHFIGH